MSKVLTITMAIKNENGETIVLNESERTVPYVEEVENQGFRAAFNELETAVLESRKEVSEKTISDYLEDMSKKKRMP